MGRRKVGKENIRKLTKACPANKLIYTYLLKNKKDKIFYTGISKDPQERLKSHNSGNNYSTKRNSCWLLVYQKAHKTYIEARKHEKWLKKKNRAYKNKLAG